MEESSPLRLRLGDDLLLSSLLSVWVGVARPRRLLRRLGVDAGDDMVLCGTYASGSESSRLLDPG